MEIKKTYLNLYIAPDVKQVLERVAKSEDRKLSNLCDRLLGWCVKWLDAAGDSQTLLTWKPRRRSRRSARVSEELQDELYEALYVIFERAPGTVVERVAEYLRERAGKCGDEK